MNDRAFTPGFRFSALDAVVLVIGAAATVGFTLIDDWIGPAIGFVVLHFFLFCNIVRMSRPLELLWAAVFAAMAALATSQWMTWPFAFGLSLLSTVIFVTIEMRRPSYHGVAWKIINPQLPAWWRERKSEGKPTRLC